MVHDHKHKFLQIFNETARYHHRYQVFRDFVMMAGISVHNAIIKDEILEQEYLDIVKRYERPDVDRFPQLLAELVMGLEVEPCDFLGDLFMQLELGSGALSQHFTPFSISKLMSMVTIGDNLDKLLLIKPFICISEPAAGGGSTVIAFAQTMREKGFNPQKHLWVNCVDIDPVAAMMCYLQLSLLHIPGEVVTGNSLTLQFSRVMRTPAHYLGNWDYKLSKQYTEPVQNYHEPVSMPVKQVNLKPLGEQISLFNLESFACETLTP